MHKLSFLLFLTFGFTQAQQYQSGDLVFQNLDCGGLCDAIEAVTEGHNHQSFSHIGLVLVRNDSTLVIEAIGKDVHLTPIDEFKKRSAHPLVHARLKIQYQPLISTAISFALNQQGLAYDDAFLYDNGKYYCSELIYDAFLFANNNKPFFTLEPMTFKQPNTNTFFPVWVTYYKQLGMEIPEGKPGINPGGISRSNKIEFIP